MAVPAATVKAICTKSEAALVRRSRSPHLSQLTLAQAKQLAARARKLADKWSDQSRSQARTKSRQVGHGESAKNTQLKAQAFRDALDSFTAQAAKLDAAPAAPAPKAANRPTKARRSAKHRATRADVRKSLSAEKLALNAPVRKRKAKKAAAKVAAAPLAPAPSTAAKSPPKKSKKSSAAAPAPAAKPAPKKTGKKPTALSLVGQRQAKTAAKQSRLAASGKTSRVRGHVLARGRRKQASRDAKN